jgi:hypothetical protein
MKTYILSMTDNEDISFYHIPTEWGEWYRKQPPERPPIPQSLLDAYQKDHGTPFVSNGGYGHEDEQLLAREDHVVAGNVKDLFWYLVKLAGDNSEALEIEHLKGMHY